MTDRLSFAINGKKYVPPAITSSDLPSPIVTSSADGNFAFYQIALSNTTEDATPDGVVVFSDGLPIQNGILSLTANVLRTKPDMSDMGSDLAHALIKIEDGVPSIDTDNPGTNVSIVIFEGLPVVVMEGDADTTWQWGIGCTIAYRNNQDSA